MIITYGRIRTADPDHCVNRTTATPRYDKLELSFSEIHNQCD